MRRSLRRSGRKRLAPSAGAYGPVDRHGRGARAGRGHLCRFSDPGRPAADQAAVALAARWSPRPGAPVPSPSAARDRRVKTDDDLRKLLVKRPKGTRDAAYLPGENGWMGIADYAEEYTKPANAFGDLIKAQFRRAMPVLAGRWAARTAWRSASSSTGRRKNGRLRRRRRGPLLGQQARSTQVWAVPDGRRHGLRPHQAGHQPGHLPMYEAEAHAWRGDIAMEIWIYDTKPIPKAKIMDLAERQMERL